MSLAKDIISSSRMILFTLKQHTTMRQRYRFQNETTLITFSWIELICRHRRNWMKCHIFPCFHHSWNIFNWNSALVILSCFCFVSVLYVELKAMLGQLRTHWVSINIFFWHLSAEMKLCSNYVIKTTIVCWRKIWLSSNRMSVFLSWMRY